MGAEQSRKGSIAMMSCLRCYFRSLFIKWKMNGFTAPVIAVPVLFSQKKLAPCKAWEVQDGTPFIVQLNPATKNLTRQAKNFVVTNLTNNGIQCRMKKLQFQKILVMIRKLGEIPKAFDDIHFLPSACCIGNNMCFPPSGQNSTSDTTCSKWSP